MGPARFEDCSYTLCLFAELSALPRFKPIFLVRLRLLLDAEGRSSLPRRGVLPSSSALKRAAHWASLRPATGFLVNSPVPSTGLCTAELARSFFSAVPSSPSYFAELSGGYVYLR